MKVTIQYAVDLGEVPFKVEELYKECLEQLETLNSSASSLNVFTPDIFVERIDSLRGKMVDIDSKLEECAALMKGYSEALKQDGNTAFPPTQPQLELPDIENSIEETQEIPKEAPQFEIKDTIPMSIPDPSEWLKKMENK